jgi:hypothetical protein
MSNTFTADLIGFISIALVALMTFLIASRWPGISKIIFVAFVMRVFLLLLGHYVVDLPDSGADAKTFENKAWFLAQDGFFNLINNFKGPDSDFISWFIAIPYSLFGRSLLMANSITLFFGIMSIFLVWKIALKIWDGHSANKAAWIITLFPSMNLYSVILLREIYVIFFLLIAFNGVVNWVKTNNLRSIAWVMTGFIGGTFFHGGIFIGALIFLSIVLKKSFLNFMKVFLAKPIKLKSIYIIILITIFSGLYFANNIKIPKIGYLKDGINLEKLYVNNEKASRGSAAYPKWLNIKSPEELFYKAPVRAIYFLFSPFPWDITSPSHLIGLFDGLLYLLLIFFIFRNRKMILQDRAVKYILLILIGYIFVFGLGVSNFGTSIRHRVKFVSLFIILSAPFLPKFFIKKKT